MFSKVPAFHFSIQLWLCSVSDQGVSRDSALRVIFISILQLTLTKILCT